MRSWLIALFFDAAAVRRVTLSQDPARDRAQWLLRFRDGLVRTKRADMTWVGVSGSWRHAPPGLPDDVHQEVAAALKAGKGIVTGGALGVDYWATETALNIDPRRLKVILPTSFATYATHYRQRAAEGVISAQQAEDLIRQLKSVAQTGSLVEHPERPQVVDVTTYYLRNQDVVDAVDELLAFQVNASRGTQDTVDKARLKGIPVTVITYNTE
jgi:hypothetical protein